MRGSCLLALIAMLSALPAQAEEARGRPRFGLSIGMGVAVEGIEAPATSVESAVVPKPVAFAADGEINGHWAGFLARVGAVSGAENTKMGYDRLSITGALAVRPWRLSGEGLGARMARRLAGEIGAALEHLNAGAHAADRFALHVGVHGDIPITGEGENGLFGRVAVVHRFRLFGDETLEGIPSCGQQGQSRCRVEDSLVEIFAFVGVAF